MPEEMARGGGRRVTTAGQITIMEVVELPCCATNVKQARTCYRWTRTAAQGTAAYPVQYELRREFCVGCHGQRRPGRPRHDTLAVGTNHVGTLSHT